MPCVGDGTTGIQPSPWTFVNWSGTRRIPDRTRYRPTSVEQLVAAIVEVERAGATVKAVGSGWSYTDAAVDESAARVIDTTGLDQNLTGAAPTEDTSAAPTSVIPFALRSSLRSKRGSQARHFVHVEAGIKIYDLNFLLDGLEPRLAMPTLGGSNGQSLAGVISTGTHGADMNLPPIADFVRAIHLVGPGGQEWWIEPAGANAITDPALLLEARDAGLLCPEIRIEHDDMLFRAALVSLGRMGVIYSAVVEVVPAFRLSQSRLKSTWNVEAARLRQDVATAGSNDLPARFKEFVVSPYPNSDGERDCVVTTRDLHTGSEPNRPPAQEPDVFKLFCDQQQLNQVLLGLAASLPLAIATATATALAGIAWIAAIPFIGPPLFGVLAPTVITAATAGLTALLTAVLALTAVQGANVSEKIAGICNIAVTVGQKQIVPDLVGAMTTALRPTGGGTVIDDGFRLMTEQRETSDQARQPDPPCMRAIDGFEFAFDLTPGKTGLFDFMTEVFSLTDEFYATNMPVGFGMSLRITRGTSALLGMQQFERTAHVEFFFLRGLTGNVDFYTRLHATAARHGGIPHWGLIQSLTSSEVERLYGANLAEWRVALGRVILGGSGRSDTFRTTFSLERGLEPAFFGEIARPEPATRLQPGLLTGLLARLRDHLK